MKKYWMRKLDRMLVAEWFYPGSTVEDLRQFEYDEDDLEALREALIATSEERDGGFLPVLDWLDEHDRLNWHRHRAMLRAAILIDLGWSKSFLHEVAEASHA